MIFKVGDTVESLINLVGTRKGDIGTVKSVEVDASVFPLIYICRIGWEEPPDWGSCKVAYVYNYQIALVNTKDFDLEFTV